MSQSISNFDRAQKDYAMTMKLFDFMEYPVRQYVADFLEMPYYTLFNDSIAQDFLIFEDHGRRWIVKYVIAPSGINLSTHIDMEFWKKNRSEKFDNAIKLILQAMPSVFAVTMRALHEEKKAEELTRPEFTLNFDPQYMCFGISVQNAEEIKLAQLRHKFSLLSAEINKLHEQKAANALELVKNSDSLDELERKCADLENQRSTIINMLGEVDNAELRRVKDLEKKHEELIRNSKKLYITVSPAGIEDSENMKIRRILPATLHKYQ